MRSTLRLESIRGNTSSEWFEVVQDGLCERHGRFTRAWSTSIHQRA
jgi:hypothetical protein